MTRETLIAHMNSWLLENGWFAGKRELDFILEVRRMVEDLPRIVSHPVLGRETQLGGAE